MYTCVNIHLVQIRRLKFREQNILPKVKRYSQYLNLSNIVMEVLEVKITTVFPAPGTMPVTWVLSKYLLSDRMNK